jgi:hypothetical protein
VTVAHLARVCLLVLVLGGNAMFADDALRVGFGEKDITPEVGKDKPAVWLAGYGYGRRATGIHDRLMVRATVLSDGEHKIAIAAVDVVGLQYDTVQVIREKLKGFQPVTIVSTHNHEGPDVVGIWGPTPFQRGVNDEYLKLLVDQTAAAIREADAKLAKADALFGTADDETLVDDNRKPLAKDATLRVLQFRSGDRTIGLLVQWNCHPESMGSRNTEITGDLVASTVQWLQKKYECPVVYVSGAIGGLMAPPDNRIKDAAGKLLNEGDFEYMRLLGEETGQLAARAVEAAEPIRLTPIHAAVKQLAVPVENKIYRLARQAGVLTREGRVWTGDANKLGEPLGDPKPGGDMAVVTEVGCLGLGELTIFNIPGELYPELVYGKFQDPADPAADFLEAALEPTVASLSDSGKWMLFGLANDELGYIIPKRQWDERSPFCYGRAKSQYGEINSCGPEVAPILMKGLSECYRELK